MPPPKRIIRSVKDIRTRSGAPDQVLVPYKAYMAITALEMEKFRRETERDTLMMRLNNVHARLQKVEIEKASLLQRLGKEGPARPSGGRSSLPGQSGIARSRAMPADLNSSIDRRSTI